MYLNNTHTLSPLSLYIHSIISDHMGYLQILAAIKHAVMNIKKHGGEEILFLFLNEYLDKQLQHNCWVTGQFYFQFLFLWLCMFSGFWTRHGTQGLLSQEEELVEAPIFLSYWSQRTSGGKNQFDVYFAGSKDMLQSFDPSPDYSSRYYYYPYCCNEN